MRIGIVATPLFGVDGVTFEAAKWEHVLERMGHEVRLLAGEVDPLRPTAKLVPPMHFSYPPAARVTAAAFDPASDAAAVRAEIDRLAVQLVPVMESWMVTHRIELLIVQNAWAIPMHLPLAVALRRLVENTGLPAIGHHHDYWWERERFGDSVVPEVLEAAFPPNLPNVRHVSINSLAARELRRHRGIASSVVPNVFDFSNGRRATRRAGRRPAAVRSRPVRAGLRWHPPRPAHTLHDAYLAADLITYPSLYEGYGNALVEAIYYGKPVVV